jgi:hypothetical protein
MITSGQQKPFKNLIFDQTTTNSTKLTSVCYFVFKETLAKNGCKIFSDL